MSANSKRSISKRSMSSGLALILLGMAALYGGDKMLIVLIPAALLIWYSSGPLLGSGRN